MTPLLETKHRSTLDSIQKSPLPIETKTVILETWNQFPAALIKHLKDLQYNQDTIFMRHFSRKRLGCLFESGTDRDSSSQLWDYPEDCNHRCDEFNISPAKVTYGREVNLKSNPLKATSIGWLSKLPDAGNLDYLYKLEKSLAIAVYDSSGLDRKTQNEFHFTQDPSRILLGVFLIGSGLKK